MRYRTLTPVFVDHIPDELEGGRLYVSMPYATAIHRCCCGCAEEVVTPLSPTDWKLTYDGIAVSLWPSIGNWDSECRSHYIIRDGAVLEAGSWSDERISAGRVQDRIAKAAYYEQAFPSKPPLATSSRAKEGLLAKMSRWWRGS